MSKSAANVLETTTDIQHMEDIGFMTCMTLVLMCNYAQTGHFGGPLAYTPFNVMTHLAGPDKGGLRYDYRRPKHPYSDKFMLAAGHCAPTCYALWMILGEALYRKFQATGGLPAPAGTTSATPMRCCPSMPWGSVEGRRR